MKYFNLYYNRNFKTGINPSIKQQFKLATLTPTQKLQLTSCRIFNTTISDQYGTGRTAIKSRIGNSRQEHYRYLTLREFNPFIEEYPLEQEYKREKFERRKQRVLMRGVKIGNRRSALQGGDNMNIFSQKKNI